MFYSNPLCLRRLCAVQDLAQCDAKVCLWNSTVAQLQVLQSVRESTRLLSDRILFASVFFSSRHQGSYNISWHDPSKFFDKISDVNTSLLKPCGETRLMESQAAIGFETHLSANCSWMNLQVYTKQ